MKRLRFIKDPEHKHVYDVYKKFLGLFWYNTGKFIVINEADASYTKLHLKYKEKYKIISYEPIRP